MNHLLAALEARSSGSPSQRIPPVVLDPVAMDEAGRLWEASQAPDGDLQAVSLDVLSVLALLHWIRYQVLPEGRDQDDLRMAVGFLGVLMDRAPEHVPDYVRSFFSDQAKSAADAERLAARASERSANTSKPADARCWTRR